MKKRMCKVILCWLLVCLAALSGLQTVLAAEPTAELSSVYGDGMLFLQNSTAILRGTAAAGHEIRAVLTDETGSVMAEGSSEADGDGAFSVAFPSPAGGYREYMVSLYDNGARFAELGDVVFGELWLASGQSNMQRSFSSDPQGLKMQQNGETLSEWLRFLQTTADPQNLYGGVPSQPQSDLPGSRWVKGSDTRVFSSSAVAVYFAQQLQERLDMPVGILQTVVGGSNLSIWLPRDAIEQDAEVKSILQQRGYYIPLSDWNDGDMDIHTAATGAYNTLIAPLTGFRLSGMVWYQGENEARRANRGADDYSKQFDLLQRALSEAFDYAGLLPVVYSQLASYGYSEDFRLQYFNMQLTQMQAARPESRAVAAIYDVPLTYTEATHAIHPLEKSMVGKRLAFCAEGLVYGLHDTYTAASVQSLARDGSALVLTLQKTGDGLVAGGGTLKGFAIAGADGIYLPAEAQILSGNTLRLSNEAITEPVAATYAVSQYNGRSNLFAVVDGERLPVSPFMTDRALATHLWKDNGWTDCEDSRIWRTHENALTGYYDTWSVSEGSWQIEAQSAYTGQAGLTVRSDNGAATVSPVLTDANGERLMDIDGSFAGYRQLSFAVRNNGSGDITFAGLAITFGGDAQTFALSGQNTAACTIPADGLWHTVTVDLQKIYLPITGETVAQSGELVDVTALSLRFASADGALDCSLDAFQFLLTAAPQMEEEPEEMSFLDRILAFFQRILDFFRRLFGLQ